MGLKLTSYSPNYLIIHLLAHLKQLWNNIPSMKVTTSNFIYTVLQQSFEGSEGSIALAIHTWYYSIINLCVQML